MTHSNTMTALADCPFCGGEAELSDAIPMGIGNARFRITCTLCGVESARDGHATAGIAIVRWNSRKLASTISTTQGEAVAWRDACEDALSGWRYIRQQHGDLYGVDWDRVQKKLEDALNGTPAYPQPAFPPPAPMSIGLDWEISDETRKHLDDLREQGRASAETLRNTVVGEPAPSGAGWDEAIEALEAEMVMEFRAGARDPMGDMDARDEAYLRGIQKAFTAVRALARPTQGERPVAAVYSSPNIGPQPGEPDIDELFGGTKSYGDSGPNVKLGEARETVATAARQPGNAKATQPGPSDTSPERDTKAEDALLFCGWLSEYFKNINKTKDDLTATEGNTIRNTLYEMVFPGPKVEWVEAPAPASQSTVSEEEKALRAVWEDLMTTAGEGGKIENCLATETIKIVADALGEEYAEVMS